MSVNTLEQIQCFHCGQVCNDTFWSSEKPFCCYGCKTVFEILEANDLCEFYNLNDRNVAPLKMVNHEAFHYLDQPKIREKILTFDSEAFARVSFFVPAIHCISCIWLLENLKRIDKGILRSEVNFSRKTVVVDFNPGLLQLGRLAGLLSSLGYPPKITLGTKEHVEPVTDRSLIIKLSVAGFCFGNVMLFSFPEYLGLDHQDQTLMRVFSWLNLGLSLPVFLYSATGYFMSAAKSFKQRRINIDVPIAGGLLALFLRSSYDVISGQGPGYLDSFTGLVFFLLIGRWFQSKTYEALSFDRDFKSYFPLAVQKKFGDLWKPVVIYDLCPGDTVRIRNMEIIPTDASLVDAQAYIDYSFVTGESKPVKAKSGDGIYAGGRLTGRSMTFIVSKKTSQSHLARLWNNEIFQKVNENKYQKPIDQAALFFTWIVVVLAVLTAIYWQITNPSQMWLVLTSVLMVACPCALALAAPFTYGNMLRVFGKNEFYLKNADVIERLAAIDSVVFDKTGTVTHGSNPEVKISGAFSRGDLIAIKLLASNSTHPISQLIVSNIHDRVVGSVSSFKEISGKGLQGIIEGRKILIGSAEFVSAQRNNDQQDTTVFVAIDDQVKGYFSIGVTPRKNIKNMLDRLGKKCVALLSGDNEAGRVNMAALFDPSVRLLFNQSPHEKLSFIHDLQAQGKNVMMVGDGLNDAGALKQSDVGIAVTDNTGVFTPACDGILKGDKIGILDKFIELAKSAKTILKTAFVISFMYNAITLTIAITGNLSPLVAAVLMPVSSISVVGFSSLAVNYVSKRKMENLN